jgi:putative transposase
MMVRDGLNQRWSLDFISDSLICGRRFRVLFVVVDYTPECLALVARELTSLVGGSGKPHAVVSDNGTQLTSSAILRWSQERRVERHYIVPAKPLQNGLAAPPFGSWRASKVACGTNGSTERCSPRWSMLGSCLPLGGTITIR